MMSNASQTFPTSSPHPRRVLILSASAGTGHLQAASALEKVCQSHPDVVDVKNIDALNYTNKLFRDFYSKLYIQLVQNAPDFLGWWYDTSDEPWKTDKMRLMLDRLNTGPLVDLITKMKPDITICTHFLPAEIISHLISRKKISARLSIVVTDFDFHAMWLSRIFHRYFVALEEARVHLKMLGFPEERITVSGIPIDPKFAEPKDGNEIRKKHGLQIDKPVLLLSAGALGVGPVEQVIRVLRYLQHSVQIVVVCGRNEEVQQRVREQVARFCPAHLSFHVLGYTEEMDEWMSAADLFIGKPGGLTTSEALSKGLPMVIFSPIPGQEERNSDHLLEKGAAIKCNDITTMAFKIDRLLDQPRRLHRLRRAALNMARPHAAQTIVSTLLQSPHGDPVTVPEESQEQMAERFRKK